MSDGSVRGSLRNAYNGQDFISFDLEYGRFVAADGAAEITRRRWEQDGTVAEARTNYLRHICPEWLQKYVGYGEKELERKATPPQEFPSGFGTASIKIPGKLPKFVSNPTSDTGDVPNDVTTLMTSQR
ncbi:hypothetical protein HGM15179_020724 [Zosterops borbonicus]|uniref:MHC class I-like antigen recognition-like domain-containing protein n=1 Tax=Zosterops borbonicus TaxID=364589 RepID=A0A8K1FTW8_9PASS|nr:hypothetical protein HGM15179_020724 [Zosterops borbonicus]